MSDEKRLEVAGFPRLMSAKLWSESYLAVDKSTSFAIRTILGCGIMAEEHVRTLVSLFKGMKVLVAFSGNGLFSSYLRRAGVEVTAVDDESQSWDKVFVRDVTGDPVEYARENISRFGAVLMSWPPRNSAAPAEILRLMSPGQILVHLGEDEEGAGATDGFFSTLREEFEPMEEETEALQEYTLSYPGVYDDWSVYVKKSEGM